MRRLLLLSLAAAAAFSFSPPASAGHECLSQGYGVRLGDFEAGVCAGLYCYRICMLEVAPYCEGSAPLATLCPAV